MNTQSNRRMSAASEAFVAAAKERASFDVDFSFCIENNFKLSNHSPSTDGHNLFDPEVGVEVDKKLNPGK